MAFVPLSGGQKPPDLSQNTPIEATHTTQDISLKNLSPTIATLQKINPITVAHMRLGSNEQPQDNSGPNRAIQIYGECTQAQELHLHQQSTNPNADVSKSDALQHPNELQMVGHGVTTGQTARKQDQSVRVDEKLLNNPLLDNSTNPITITSKKTIHADSTAPPIRRIATTTSTGPFKGHSTDPPFQRPKEHIRQVTW